MGKLLFNCILAMLCPVLYTYAYPTSFHPLSVGDTLPAVALEILQRAASKTAGEGTSGPFVIDFWEKGCGSCLGVLAKLDSLQKSYPHGVRIVTVTSKGSLQELTTFLGKFPSTKNVNLPIVTNDTLLGYFFPHQLISHIVWINSEGIVCGITGSDYVKHENMEALIAGNKFDWPQKNDLIGFDYAAPLVGFASQPVQEQSAWLFYSAISGHIKGAEATQRTVPDPAGNTLLVSYFNMSLLQLCHLALENAATAFEPKLLLLQVKDSGAFLYNPSKGYKTAWKQRNTWCYSVQLPLAATTDVKKTVQRDLTHQLQQVFGINVGKQLRTMEVLLIRKTRSPEKETKNVQGRLFSNLSDLVYAFNRESPLPYLIDETGHPDSPPLSVPASAVFDREVLAAGLAEYGYSVVLATKELRCYSISNF